MAPDLRALIHATHGDNGQCKFARGLGVGDRTVRRWLAKGLSPERWAQCVAYARSQGVQIEERCPTCGLPAYEPPAEMTVKGRVVG